LKRKELEERIEALMEEYLKTDETDLVDVEFVKEGPNHYLRIYIDKPSGVTIDDCERVSRYVDERLDQHDEWIQVAYYLEVSSPGLDRPFKKEKDYHRNIGNLVEVKLYQNLNGTKHIRGTLKEYQDDTLTLILDNQEEIMLEHKQIALVKPAIIF